MKRFFTFVDNNGSINIVSNWNCIVLKDIGHIYTLLDCFDSKRKQTNICSNCIISYIPVSSYSKISCKRKLIFRIQKASNIVLCKLRIYWCTHNGQNSCKVSARLKKSLYYSIRCAIIVKIWITLFYIKLDLLKHTGCYISVQNNFSLYWWTEPCCSLIFVILFLNLGIKVKVLWSTEFKRNLSFSWDKS